MERNNKINDSDRKKVKVSEQQDQKYKRQLNKFQNNLRLSQQSFQSSNDQDYYLLSLSFINQFRQFCKSDKPQRYQLSYYNSDLIDPNSKSLKPGLRQSVDFQIVNYDCMRTILMYAKGQTMERKARMVGHQKKVQIYLPAYTYIDLRQNDLKQIDKNDLTLSKFENRVKKIQQSQQATIKQLLKNIAKAQRYTQSRQQRLWLIPKDTNIQQLYKDIQSKVRKVNCSYAYDYKVKGFGRRIDDTNTKIADLNLEEGQYFLIQDKDDMRDWFLQTDSEGKCEGCYKMKQLKFPCACKKVAYCTDSCKERDKRYHESRCPAIEEEELNQQITMSMSSSSMRGLVGLSNLGNTCFMNSCLQCLSNTYPLTQYFLSSHYDKEINKVNPLGSKGKLAKCYAKFIKAMWCDSSSTFSPYNLKSAVSQIAPQFSGYAQHDSQQFFSFIVDGLHEDLNRIQKKPYVQSVESGQKDDKQIACESWIAHIKRNQSIIVDLMTGQYKSKVVCPDCQKQSITFDPFITVTLPIPQQNSNSVQPYVIFNNFSQETKKISVKYNKPNIDEWTNKASQILKIEPQRLRFYLLSMSEGIYQINSQTIVSAISRIENQGKSLFLVELSQEQLKLRDSIQITCRFSKKSFSYEPQSMWFKFPFFFDRKKMTGITVYKRILKYLYNQAYDNSSKRSSYWGSKNIEEYEKTMLKQRPFVLYLRSNLKKQKYYSKIEYKYEDETQIEDNSNLQEMIEKLAVKQYEIDARFSKDGLKNFTFEHLKQFKDCVDKDRRGYSSEDITVKLQECLDILGQPERLQHGNQWYCPICKDHKLATKQLQIYKAPQILILHLKRFKQKGNYRKQKNQSQVIFPMVMDFSPYILDPTPFDTYREQAIKENAYIQPSYQVPPLKQSKPIYELYAVSNHYGGLGGGHYTAFGKNINGKWYEFNDSSVRSTSESSVCSSGAYILFYKRKD